MSRNHSPRVPTGTVPRALLLLAAGLLPGASGCFFTDDINRVPRADVQVLTPGPHYRDSSVTFSASKSGDDDGDAVQVSWSARTCNAQHNICDPALEERNGLDRGEPFTITIPSWRPGGEATAAVVVVAEVIDSRGARQQDRVFIDVLNRAPALTLQSQGLQAPVSGGYPIGTTVRVVASGSDPDGDPLDYEWQYYSPPGSVPGDVGWERIDEVGYALTADVTGLWTVEVTATDVLGEATTERVQIAVAEDAPPCIDATEPSADDLLAVPEARYILDRDAPPRRFAVLGVEDDLDLYPPPSGDPADNDGSPLGSASFRWLVATPDTGGALTEVAGHLASSYLLDASAYAPGDQVDLRVEIDDRVGRELPCSEDRPTCSLEGNTCLQRVTWRMEMR